MGFGSFIATASGLVALAVLVGYGLQRGRITTLRDSLKDADDENTRLERRLGAAEEGLKQAQRDLEALQRVVTREVQLTAISDQLEHMNTMLVEIRDSLGRRSE